MPRSKDLVVNLLDAFLWCRRPGCSFPRTGKQAGRLHHNKEGSERAVGIDVGARPRFLRKGRSILPAAEHAG